MEDVSCHSKADTCCGDHCATKAETALVFEAVSYGSSLSWPKLVDRLAVYLHGNLCRALGSVLMVDDAYCRPWVAITCIYFREAFRGALPIREFASGRVAVLA